MFPAAASPQQLMAQAKQIPQTPQAPNTVSTPSSDVKVAGELPAGPQQVKRVPQSATKATSRIASGARKIAEKAKGLQKREFVKAKPEWALYKDTYGGQKNQRYLIASIVTGIAGAAAAVKWARERERGIWAVATIALVTVSGATLYLYYSDTVPVSAGASSEAGYGYGGANGEMTGQRVGAGLVQDRSEDDAQAETEQKQETLGEALAKTGVDPSKQEGPRADYGYQRAPATALASSSERISASSLMRDPRNFNMDQSTLNEYVARLEGHAPMPFHQVQPYMPNSAQFEHNSAIDNAESVFGLSSSPDTMNRKYAYRNPKMQQAGAKSMHYKDPPPGAIEPLDKVHPWMDIDESGKERMRVDPSTYLNSERSLGAEDVHELMKSREKEEEMIKAAMQGKVNEAFLQPVHIQKRRAVEPEDAHGEKAASDWAPSTSESGPETTPATPVVVAPSAFEGEPASHLKDGVHTLDAKEVSLVDSTAPEFRSSGLHGDGGDVAVGAVDLPDSFLGAFREKKTPTEAEVEAARIEDTRR